MWRRRRAQYGPPRELWRDSEDYISSQVLCVRRAVVLSLASICFLLFLLDCESLVLHYHFDPKWIYKMSEGLWTLFWVLRCILTVSPGKHFCFFHLERNISPRLAYFVFSLNVTEYFSLLTSVTCINVLSHTHIHSNQVKGVLLFFFSQWLT